MLKPMPRPSANHPHVIHPRMPVQNKTTVRSLLILAHPRLNQRSIFHPRKSKPQIFSHALQRRLSDDSLAASGIERGPARIVRHLKPAPVAARNAIKKSLPMIAPHRKMRVRKARVSGGRPEEKNVLLGRANQIAHSFRKKLTQPWPARENIVISSKPRAIGERQTPQRSMLQAISQNRDLPVCSASAHKSIYHCLATGASIEVSALGFEDSPLHIRKTNLRPTFLHLGRRQFLKLDPGLAKHCQRPAFKSIVAAADHP